MPVDEPVLPDYQRNCNADVLPSVCDGLSVPGAFDILGLGESAQVAVIVVDGLGAEQLSAHGDLAPTLRDHHRRALTTVLPSTTAAALTSIGTGVTPLEHGLVGTSFSLAGDGSDILKPLNWGDEPSPNLVAPVPTWWSRAAAAGVRVSAVSARAYRRGGLTHAALGGAEYLPADTAGESSAAVSAQLDSGARTLVYGYWSGLDRVAHVHGAGSPEYCDELQHVDLYVRTIADRLSPGQRLIVTSDHGVLNTTEPVDVDSGEFRTDVHRLVGEPRMRMLHVRPGAQADVVARWRELLADGALVRTREQVLDEGWFGPRGAHHDHRLGDVIVAALGELRLTAPGYDRVISGLPGQHGSVSSAEMLVPLVVIEG